WCAKPIYGQRYATRSPKAVVEEMAWLKRRFAPDHLWVVDDVFGLKPGWVEEFAALVNERKARIPFRCLMRADQVTESVAAALARTPWDMRPSHARRAASWIYNRAALAVTRHRLRPLRAGA